MDAAIDNAQLIAALTNVLRTPDSQA